MDLVFDNLLLLLGELPGLVALRGVLAPLRELEEADSCLQFWARILSADSVPLPAWSSAAFSSRQQ